MNLQTYISPLLKYWWLLLAAAFVATASSFLVTRSQAPVYQTTTTMMVGRSVYEANPSSNDFWLGQQLANYYADIGQRGEVQNATREALGLNQLPSYTIQPLPNSQLLEVVVIDTNPARAQAVANELANQLIQRSPTSNATQGQERTTFINGQITYLEEKIRETLENIDKAEIELSELDSARQIGEKQTEIAALQAKLAQLQTNYAALLSNTEQGASNTLTIIERAPLPTKPIGPNKLMTIGLSALIAMVIAAAAAYLLEFLDDTLKTPEEITQMLGVPALASIAIFGGSEAQNNVKKSPLAQALARRFSFLPFLQTKEVADPNDTSAYIYSAAHPRSSVAEEFRSLRINLEFTDVDHKVKTIFVTSADPNEGKTSVSTNLAIVMAQSGKKVLLVDADLRKPSVDRHFQIQNKKGLSDIFRENLNLYDVAAQWKETSLWIITAGTIPPNPVDLLSSQKMNAILEEMKAMADVVIIDGPPLAFSDSLALASKVDGVMMVIRHAYTRRGAAQARAKQLQQASARIIGVVLNNVPGKKLEYYSNYHYYNYYKPEKEPEVEPKRIQ